MTFQVTIMFGLRLMSFLSAILNFVGLFLLKQIDWNFVHGFFCSHLELEFQISDHRPRLCCQLESTRYTELKEKRAGVLNSASHSWKRILEITSSHLTPSLWSPPSTWIKLHALVHATLSTPNVGWSERSHLACTVVSSFHFIWIHILWVYAHYKLLTISVRDQIDV